MQISQTIDRQKRTQIAVPAQGLVEFKNALTELLDEFGTENGAGEMRINRTDFYFCAPERTSTVELAAMRKNVSIILLIFIFYLICLIPRAVCVRKFLESINQFGRCD